MMKKQIYYILIFMLLFSCKGNKNQKDNFENSKPIISNDGLLVEIPDTSVASFFETEKISSDDVIAKVSFGGRVAASIHSSSNSNNIVLFSDSELSSTYSALNQLKVEEKVISTVGLLQKKREFERIQELHKHGAATGQELLEVEVELANIKSSLENIKIEIAEQEAVMLAAGFDIYALQNAKSGISYLICDLPENQIKNVAVGEEVKIKFAAYSNSEFIGVAEAISDIIDSETRMLKVRVRVDNKDKQIKTGMFADVTFELKGDSLSTLSEYAFVTLQGKHYVFVRKENNVFERREVEIGQQLGDRVVVVNGLEDDDEVVIKGVMQLKGLSFGF